MCEALSGSQEIVSKVVTAVLNTKVDSDGNPSRYGERDQVTYIQWLCSEAIQKATRQAVQNYINGSNEKIVKEIERALTARPKSIAMNFVNSLMGLAKNEYHIKVDVSAMERERTY